MKFGVVAIEDKLYQHSCTVPFYGRIRIPVGSILEIEIDRKRLGEKQKARCFATTNRDLEKC